MNKVQSVLIFAVVCGLSPAAQEKPAQARHLAPPSAQKDMTPVTKAEARAALIKMQSILWKTLKLTTAQGSMSVASASSPVTREEVVREFFREFTLLQPSFKFTPAKVKFDSSMLTLQNRMDRPKLEKLIAWGTVAKVGPIAAGSTSTLTVHQLGDAIGFYVARIADLAHIPSSRWTPYLNGGRG